MTQFSASVRNRFLSNLEAADFALIQPYLQDVALPLGVRLHQVETAVEYAYFPHTGVVSLVVPCPSGAAVETGLIGREGIIDGLATLGAPRCITDATVLVPGTAARIHYPLLRDAVGRSPRLRDGIVRYGAVLMAQAQQSAACNAVHSGESRVCRWLLEVSDRLDDNRVPATQESLADNLGLRRTTITAIAQRLQAVGAIRYRRGYIAILDRALLKSLACECYDQVKRHTAHLVGVDHLDYGRELDGPRQPVLIEGAPAAGRARGLPQDGIGASLPGAPAADPPPAG